MLIRKMVFRTLLWLTLPACMVACDHGGISNVAPGLQETGLSGIPKPLIVVDGVAVKGKIKNPEDIRILTVHSKKPDQDLINEYGPEAKNGVIFIATARK